MDNKNILDSLENGKTYLFKIKNREDGTVVYDFIPVESEQEGKKDEEH